jgi:hypothetical protein
MTELACGKLVGSWRLVTAKGKLSDSGKLVDLLGPDPLGFCTFDANGRWTVVTTASGLATPTSDLERAGLFTRMVAFTGRYHIDGDLIVTKVDVAWSPALVGSDLTRVADLDGDQLTLIQPEWEHPFFPGRKMVGIVVWSREQ